MRCCGIRKFRRRCRHRARGAFYCKRCSWQGFVLLFATPTLAILITSGQLSLKNPLELFSPSEKFAQVDTKPVTLVPTSRKPVLGNQAQSTRLATVDPATRSAKTALTEASPRLKVMARNTTLVSNRHPSTIRTSLAAGSPSIPAVSNAPQSTETPVDLGGLVGLGATATAETPVEPPEEFEPPVAFEPPVEVESPAVALESLVELDPPVAFEPPIAVDPPAVFEAPVAFVAPVAFETPVTFKAPANPEPLAEIDPPAVFEAPVAFVDPVASFTDPTIDEPAFTEPSAPAVAEPEVPVLADAPAPASEPGVDRSRYESASLEHLQSLATDLGIAPIPEAKSAVIDAILERI